MSGNEDPYRQISYLEQCLRSSKRPLGLFLGAGCPTSIKTDKESKIPLIPDIDGITKSIREEIAKDQKCAEILAIVDGQFKIDGRKSVTVEDILSHIRVLGAIAGKEKVRGLSKEDVDDLDDKICTIINALADRQLPSNVSPYHHLAHWVDAIARVQPVEVFTTNYDLLAEQAFEEHKVPYFDGFSGSRRAFFDIRTIEEHNLPPRWARLWKIHGSINWYEDLKGKVYRGGLNETDHKRVIHPSHLKYDESRRMPYLAMMDRIRTFLRQSSVALVICGYSFRDQHINAEIVEGLQGTSTAIAFALLYGGLENYKSAVELALTRPNLQLLAENGAVISCSQVIWNEKEKGILVPDPEGKVTWIPADPKNENGLMRARFHLGDFVEFGKFLHSMIGYDHEGSSVPSAK